MLNLCRGRQSRILEERSIAPLPIDRSRLVEDHEEQGTATIGARTLMPE
jgi:hypothetical protein